MSTEVYFEDISASIIEKLQDASRSIRVAVAWFTDRQLFEILVQKASEGIPVIVIIRNDIINLGQAGLAWQKFLDSNGTLYFSPNSPALHHKFCLIDDTTLISGSYNWTYGAKRNRENIVLSQQVELIKAFHQEFSYLLDYALEVADLNVMLTAYPPVSDAMLVEQATAEVTVGIAAKQEEQLDEEYEDLLRAYDVAYRSKQHDNAEASLHQAIRLRPEEVEAHQLLADVYWRSGQNQKAVEAAKKAEESGVQNAALWNTYGLAYEGLGKYKDAIKYFNKSIEVAPTIST